MALMILRIGINTVAKTSTWLSTLFTGFICVVSGGANVKPLELGQKFPDILLPRADDGMPDSLRFYRGRKTVAHVFASW